MPKERFRTACAVYLVLTQDNKVLLLRRCGSGYHDGDYSLPAGHLESGETLMQALMRESEEEVDVKLDPNKTILAHVMHRSELDPPYMDFFFVSEGWKGTPEIKEPDKCDDMQWTPLDKLPENIIPYIRSAITQIYENNAYSETI